MNGENINKKIFLLFLKNKNIVSKYKYCFNKRSKSIFFDDMSSYASYVIGGFVWSDTNDGYVFWNKINDKWEKFIFDANFKYIKEKYLKLKNG